MFHCGRVLVQQESKTKAGNAGGAAAPAESKPVQVSVIDSKRAHNISILLTGKIKVQRHSQLQHSRRVFTFVLRSALGCICPGRLDDRHICFAPLKRAVWWHLCAD